jgi:5-methylcytosine-specific restriction enzyme A
VRIYRTTRWKALRAKKLAASPYCEPCCARGFNTQANTVDHIERIKDGGDPFPPLSGLMSMCESCHNSKTMRADVQGLFRFIGADASGMPIDSDHPFTRGGYVPPRQPPSQGHTGCKDNQLGGRDRLWGRVRSKLPKENI